MENLRDICLKNCKVSHEGLRNLNWKRLENINIIGVSIRGKIASNYSHYGFQSSKNDNNDFSSFLNWDFC